MPSIYVYVCTPRRLSGTISSYHQDDNKFRSMTYWVLYTNRLVNKIRDVMWRWETATEVAHQLSHNKNKWNKWMIWIILNGWFVRFPMLCTWWWWWWLEYDMIHFINSFEPDVHEWQWLDGRTVVIEFPFTILLKGLKSFSSSFYIFSFAYLLFDFSIFSQFSFFFFGSPIFLNVLTGFSFLYHAMLMFGSCVCGWRNILFHYVHSFSHSSSPFVIW